MAIVSVVEGKLVIEVEGWDKFFSLRSRLEFPLTHISRVYADPAIADSWWKGLRLGGTNLPGVITAGTFYHHGDWVFWDVHNIEKAVVFELHDERYAKLIIEAGDPAECAARVQAALTPQP